MSWFSSYEATKRAAEKPMAASKAYADIIGALKNATDTSNAAKKAADAAFDLTSSEWDDSMAQMAELSLNVSLALRNEARNAISHVSGTCSLLVFVSSMNRRCLYDSEVKFSCYGVLNFAYDLRFGRRA
jgi:hypothetical protein